MKIPTICGLLLVICLHAVPSYALDGNKLLAYCAVTEKFNPTSDAAGNIKVDTAHMSAYGSLMACSNYIEGVLDEEGHHYPYKTKICPRGDGIDSSQARRIVLKYLRSNPDKLDFPASVLVVNAIRGAFPCPATQEKRQP